MGGIAFDYFFAPFMTALDVTEDGNVSAPPIMPIFARLAAGILGCGLAGLLFLAATLTPDPSGQGTHQQLGLPPCTFTALYNMRCPSCGMTTSWSHVMHGELFSAAQANVGGMLLAFCSLAGAPWLLWTAVRGRPATRIPGDLTIALGAVAIVIITLIDWGVRMWAMG